jgi:crotonobetainyl-CoA:carnitine CoA-transferase CaiB-like acyl-CoA transferase
LVEEENVMEPYRPLAGVQVLELGGGAGAVAGRVLASLGAQVVRVEETDASAARADPRFPLSPRWAWYLLDKELVTVPASEFTGTVRAALGETDILIECHRPGTLAARGLDPRELRAAFPHLVVLSLSDYGQVGPYRDWAGSALTAYALGGSLFRCGRPTDPPLPPPVELADTIGGVTGALIAVTALVNRAARGGGDWIDCAVSEACLATSDWAIPIRSLTGSTTTRDGAGPLYPVYPVTDGFVRVLNLSPKQWAAFRAWLGYPPEFAAAEWDNLLFRLAHADVIDIVFQRETAGRKREELYRSGQEAGVSIVPVYAPEEVEADMHLRERQVLAPVEITPLGTVRVPRSFVRFGTVVPEGPRAPVRHTAVPRRRRVPRSLIDFRALKVVELGSGGVAPEAARYFALLGADVIKVESATAMDFLRAASGPGLHEFSPHFGSSNRNKRSVELDLKTSSGRETMLRLLERADVFFENNAGDVCDRLGISYAEVAARNPRIIYASSQMMGATGAARSYRGFGPSSQAISGISVLWTHPDNPKPEGVSLVHPDHLAGKMLALAALAALRERERTGRGAFIDLSQVEFAMATIGEAFVEVSLIGKSRQRGTEHPYYVPHGVFPTMLPDEWVAIAVETDEQWLALARVLNRPDWLADPVLRTISGRLAARRELTEAVTAFTRVRTRPAVVNTLQRAGVPAMPVLAPIEQLADPHLNARGAFDLVDHPVAGLARMEGLPFRCERLTFVPAQPAPLLGAHTAAVLAEWLGRRVAAT